MVWYHDALCSFWTCNRHLGGFVLLCHGFVVNLVILFSGGFGSICIMLCLIKVIVPCRICYGLRIPNIISLDSNVSDFSIFWVH